MNASPVLHSSQEGRSFRFWRMVLPLRVPLVAAVGGQLTPPGVNAVDLARILAQLAEPDFAELVAPPTTPDLCLSHPPVDPVSVTVILPATEDLTEWLDSEALAAPQVVSAFEPLRTPGRAGKKYGEPEPAEGVQRVLFSEDAELQGLCIHGLKKAWCETCLKRERRLREHSTGSRTHARTPDIFDLIFPLLQPPLGDDFDNVVAFPPGKKLFPFQTAGVKFLAENAVALLGDEMGLGKSIQTITALRVLFHQARARRVLILCPKSVLYDWTAKLWEWAPELRVAIVRGPRTERPLVWGAPTHVYLTTYETLRNDLASDAARRQYDVAILDEIQRIKNAKAGVTRAARRIDATCRWGLSGTPLENRVEDVISIFAFLKPGLLKLTDALDPGKVKRAIRPYFLRRRIADVETELPQKVTDEVWLDLEPAQRRTYDEAERGGKSRLKSRGDRVTVQHVFALISELKQLCNLDPSTGQSAKLEYLAEQLRELREADEKSLVFSQYPSKTLEQVEPRLREFNPKLFHGGLSAKQRDQIVRAFQDGDEYRTLLLSVRAGGLGLTLTRANHVFHFDLWWNPAVARQAEGRAYRIGQERTVFVTTLYTVGTIEERIHRILQRKQHLFEEVIDDLSDTGLGKVLTEEELFSLFDLEHPRGAMPLVPSAAARRGRIRPGAIDGLSPGGFEQLVAQLYARMGFHTRLTPATADGGIDIYARRDTGAGRDTILIQCKHYPHGKVGVDKVRELYGVLSAQPDATRGVLATSGGFTAAAWQFARGKNVDLVERHRLVSLLARYGLTETGVRRRPLCDKCGAANRQGSRYCTRCGSPLPSLGK